MGETLSIIETDRVRVRIMGLAAGEELPFHYHTEVTDTFFCLEGTIIVAAQNPAESWQLGPGEHCKVVAQRPHSVANFTPDAPARYLLVQGVGRYDFIPVET